VVKPQTLKGVIKQYLDLQAKWQGMKFKALVDNGAMRNHILLKAIE